MVNFTRTATYQLIEGANWMDNKTRKSALLKLDSMKEDIAYFDEHVNQRFMDAYFKG